MTSQTLRTLSGSKLSIIVPCFNEQDTIEDLYRSVCRAISGHVANGLTYEILIVDNASSDETVSRALKMQRGDACVRVIRNERNVGPNRSVWNALRLTTGDIVVYCLPADGQDPPEVIPSMVDHWLGGSDAICGVRSNRAGDRMVWLRRGFMSVARALTDLRLPDGLGDFQLLDRRIVDDMLKIPNGFRFPRVMAPSITENIKYIEYTWGARKHGISKSNLSHLLDNVSAVAGFPGEGIIQVWFSLVCVSSALMTIGNTRTPYFTTLARLSQPVVRFVNAGAFYLLLTLLFLSLREILATLVFGGTGRVSHRELQTDLH